MPGKPKPTLADHYRAHRAAMELALRTGITPREAAAQIARQSAATRSREAQARLNRRFHAPTTTDPPLAPPPQWWNQD